MPEQRWPIGTTFDPIRTYDTGIGQIDPNLVRYLRGAADTQTATTPATQQMVPVDPSFRDRLEMLLSDTFGHSPEGRRRANMFMRAAEWMPGVDEGLLFSDAGEEIEQGNLITGGVLGGLGALSMAPFVPPGAGRSLEEIMKSLKKKVKKRPDDTPVRPDSGEGKQYDSNLPVSDHAQGRRTREADIRRQQQELDLTPKARAARATEQGYVHDVYHGTLDDFSAFDLDRADIGIHVGTKEHATNRLLDMASEEAYKDYFIPGTVGHGIGRLNRRFDQGSRIMPLKARMTNTLELSDVGEWKNSFFVIDELRMHPKFQDKLPELNELWRYAEEAPRSYSLRMWKSSPENRKILDSLNTIIKEKGFDSIKYINRHEKNIIRSQGDPYSYIILDPKDLRSVHAKFDPAKAGSADLLSGIGSFAATQGIA